MGQTKTQRVIKQVTSVGSTKKTPVGSVNSEPIHLPNYSGVKKTKLEVIAHGATAATARPTYVGIVFWIGSVEPTNAENNDIWIDTS